MPHSLLQAKRTNRGPGFTHAQKMHMEVADSFNQRSRVNSCKSHYLRIHKDNRKYQSFQWPFHFLFNFWGISNMCAFFIKPYCEMFVWLLNIWLNVLKKPFGIFLRNRRIFSMKEVSNNDFLTCSTLMHLWDFLSNSPIQLSSIFSAGSRTAEVPNLLSPKRSVLFDCFFLLSANRLSL